MAVPGEARPASQCEGIRRNMGCTVTGAIIDSTGSPFTGQIVIAPAPQGARVSDGSVVSGVEITIGITDGALSEDFEPGYYWVKVPATRRFKINVPDAASAEIEDIIVSGVVNVEPVTTPVRVTDAAPTPGVRAGTELLHIDSTNDAAYYWSEDAWHLLIAGT